MTSAHAPQIPTATATNSTFESATRYLYQNDCTTKKRKICDEINLYQNDRTTSQPHTASVIVELRLDLLLYKIWFYL